MEAHPFQLKVAKYLLEGRNVVLQAPTGAGKTRAALLPYINARFNGSAEAFPRKCVYAVPMRVLVNQFADEYGPLFNSYSARYQEVEQREFRVTVQTGERAEDRKFEGDLIFTTIDQVLSNFLAIPYALSNGQANLNAAAVFGSYLVFDEFHLFPVEENGSGALGTTLEMLSWLKGITPFVLMTATFSSKMVERLCELLDAEKVVVESEELEGLISQQKERYYQTVESTLTAEAVLAEHKGRSIAICNTVGRAQVLYRELARLVEEDPRYRGVKVMLLHSRFLHAHRQEKEEWARREFGKDKSQRRAESAILVATQVIEVGLDISCESLHTELAPANAVLQRAGRCARYQGEVGQVFVYRLPEKDGKQQTAPYQGQQGKQCEATWVAFEKRRGQALGYAEEIKIIDEVHTEDDKRLLDLLADTRNNLKGTMQAVIAGPDRKVARNRAGELIRDVDNITVVIHPNPNNFTVPEPWAFEGFGLFRYSVQNDETVRALLERAEAIGLEDGVGMWTPVAMRDETENSREPLQYDWKRVNQASLLRGQTLLFVHPALATYDKHLGFRLLPEQAGNFVSPQLTRAGNKGRVEFSYETEGYKQHISRIWKVYRKNSGDEVAWVARRLEERLGLSPRLVDRAIRLTLACHDLGKLTEKWQDWAHEWQRQVGRPIKNEIMLAHTFYDAGDERHQELNRLFGRKRPHHAVEGAIAARELVHVALGKDLYLSRAVITAVARHHNADSVESGAFKMNKYAPVTLQEILDVLSKGQEWQADTGLLKLEEVNLTLTERMGLVPQSDTVGQFLYFLLVRVLRLNDGEALRL
jgi:CRISPR-associated endonuclease/helicase Cas3